MNALAIANAVATPVIRAARALARRRILVACLGLALTAVIALSYVVVGGLHLNPLRSTITVQVMLRESGGLLANQDVTLRGVRIGRVEAIDITDHGVAATAAIDSTVHIPTDSPVRVSGLSAAGEQYLDFRPEHDGGPFLAGGAVIGQSQTSIPVSLPEIIDHSRGALAQLDATKVAAMFRELRVSRDGPDKLAAIFDGASLLASTLDSVLPQTVSAIRNTKVVLSTVADLGPGLRHTTTELSKVLGGVDKMDGGFRTLVERGEPQLATVDNLVADNRQNIVQILGNLTTVSQLVYLRIPALENLWRPDRDSVVDRVSSVVRGGGIWGVGDIYPKYRCDYKLPRRPPSQADFPEPYRYTYCADADPSVLVRGARNAPRPPGDDTAGPPTGYDPTKQTDVTPNYPPYTLPTTYAGPDMPARMPN
ncbi:MULTISPECIES: MlaD family protein [unclassified Mycolicibacterium]|uniref:MlaD family protein n=1 Tax=unclassified Mycolicibacterium TaxID=2636767 RepID=UPI0012DDE4E2|nr:MULTISPECIES: MlaD family protein [unclassified Mycolicibacterium]MUM03620.1 mammalian cell entry protein [Mycolicibacterium sp. CBMA 213]